MFTILLADDEPNLRLLVRTTLEDPEYRILETGDGGTVLTLARSEKPDLILLDWMMPGLSGLDVAKALRQDAATADVPLIFLTARGQQRDREEAARLNAQGYLVKPFSPLELLDKVRKVLQ